MGSSRNSEKGFVIVMVAFCIVVLFGLLGLAFDIGRMFITKNESILWWSFPQRRTVPGRPIRVPG